MLEPALKEQLKGIFAGLEADFTFDISVSASHESRAELLELLSDVAECSDHITCMVNEGSGLKFTIGKNGKPTESKNIHTARIVETDPPVIIPY